MVGGVDELIERAEKAHEAAVCGTLSGVRDILAELEASTAPSAHAWSLALRSELWLTEPRYGRLAEPEWFEQFHAADARARRGALIALANGTKSAILAFDGRLLSEFASVAPRLYTSDLSGSARLAADSASAWAALATNRPEAAMDQANAILKRASQEQVPAYVVEGHALRALAVTALGKYEDALSLARRASLIARAESLPQMEFLAHLTLARVRRYARQPHLSLRILDALSSIVTRPWNAWLAWESCLAGGSSEPQTPFLQTAARTAVAALTRLMDAAKAGDRATFDEVVAELTQATKHFQPANAEALELCGVIDPALPASTQALSAWRSGQAVLPPASVHALRLRPADEGKAAAAYVLAIPEQPRVRLLHWGAALVETPELVHIRQSQRAQGRVETVLAILASAGPTGVDEAQCFEQAYGFEFNPAVHRGVFDVLLHRARTLLDAAASIERAEGRLCLQLNAPLLIPDPRVAQLTTDRMLRLLAERGAASAKEAASALGVSLRTAQAALAELAESGACDTKKAGRNVAYAVEDTIFSEPTRRLAASDLTGLTYATAEWS